MKSPSILEVIWVPSLEFCVIQKRTNFSDIYFWIRAREPENVVFTDREIQILIYIYEGLTTMEIAERMQKSKNTIDTHRKNMFLKCKVKNIAGLIKFGIKKGYLNPI